MSALKSAPLRQQHESIRKHIDDVKKRMNPLVLAPNAVEVRSTLTRLFGELGKHLQEEARMLYPALDAGEDAKVKQVASRFNAEMREQLPRLGEFNKRWATADSIRANGTLFLKEAGELLTWLERRVISENNELYPLLDKQDIANMAIASNPELKIARI